jgi:hypothetical protein
MGYIVCGGSLLIDILIYTNIINVTHALDAFPLIDLPPGANPGEFWMFNPLVCLGIPWFAQINPQGPAYDVLAVILFISYYVFYDQGLNLGKMMFGRYTYQRGYWYVMRPTRSVHKRWQKLEKKKQEEKQ